MTCPTCLGKGVSRASVDFGGTVGVQALTCRPCDGTGLDKTRLEAAAKAGFTAYFGDPDTQGNEAYNPMDEKEWEPVAEAVVTAYLDHTEENP